MWFPDLSPYTYLGAPSRAAAEDPARAVGPAIRRGGPSPEPERRRVRHSLRRWCRCRRRTARCCARRTGSRAPTAGTRTRPGGWIHRGNQGRDIHLCAAPPEHSRQGDAWTTAPARPTGWACVRLTTSTASAACVHEANPSPPTRASGADPRGLANSGSSRFLGELSHRPCLRQRILRATPCPSSPPARSRPCPCRPDRWCRGWTRSRAAPARRRGLRATPT